MEYRRLGHSGLKVSSVSLGSWLTYGNVVEQEQAAACLRTAIEAGVNLIDTADVYNRGKAEEALGELLKQYRRREIVLATKCFGRMSDDVNDRGLSRKHVFESCHASLERLQTDYIDLYQCHRFDPETPVEETVRALDDLARQGKILYWGVSVWSAAQIEAACFSAERQLALRPISNQPPYNLLDREIEEEVIPTSQARGLSQIVYSPLAQGLLTDKYRGGKTPEGSRLADERVNKFVKDRDTAATRAKIDGLGAIADEVGVPLAQLALAWCLRQPNVASVIMGATRPEQVAENVKAAEVSLDDATLARIEEVISDSAN